MFWCFSSGPLVQNNSTAKPVLDIAQSFNVEFGSDRVSDRFTGKPCGLARSEYRIR